MIIGSLALATAGAFTGAAPIQMLGFGEALRPAQARAAIANAVADLQTGDALVVAGKGHETGQIVGDRVLPFSDHEAIAQALKEHHP